MADYENITYEVAEQIATITLDRPDALNAISPPMERELHAALDAADADPGVRVIVLTGAGKAFSAGYDIGAGDAESGPLDPRSQSHEDYIRFWERLDHNNVHYLLHLWNLTKPVIAAVNGWAMGGGFWYQLAADVTIASERAVFAQPEVRHTSNTTFLFTALCGWKAANRYGLTGDHFDAAEAYRIGMVNEVVPHDELMPTARRLALRMAKVPEPSIRMNKAVSMVGLQVSGVFSAMALNGPLSALSHTSHGPHRERLLEAQRTGGMRAYLVERDGPFSPEPFGPKSHVAQPESPRGA
jgi:enoyl-CoA hydratase